MKTIENGENIIKVYYQNKSQKHEFIINNALDEITNYVYNECYGKNFYCTGYYYEDIETIICEIFKEKITQKWTEILDIELYI